jgi:hypothetical protein
LLASGCAVVGDIVRLELQDGSALQKPHSISPKP